MASSPETGETESVFFWKKGIFSLESMCLRTLERTKIYNVLLLSDVMVKISLCYKSVIINY